MQKVQYTTEVNINVAGCVLIVLTVDNVVRVGNNLAMDYGELSLLVRLEQIISPNYFS